MPRRGAFFVFEGLDRAGKTTQAARLCANLPNSYPVRFPDRESPTGRVLVTQLANSDEPLSSEAIHLMFAANRWEYAQWIKDTLNAGISIVCDRYSYSGIAYSVAKGLDAAWCAASERGLPAPDAVFYLDVPPEVAAQRANYGAERYERVDFQRKVADAYANLRRCADELNVANTHRTEWHTCDAAMPVDDIERVIAHVANATLKHVQDSDIQRQN